MLCGGAGRDRLGLLWPQEAGGIYIYIYMYIYGGYRA